MSLSSVTVGFILLLCAFSLTACTDPEPTPNSKPPEEVAPVVSRDLGGNVVYPERKPIETKRLNLGKTEVDETVQELPPLTGKRVEIRTWADEVYRGRLVSETRKEYVVDDGKLRRIRREAVMSLVELASPRASDTK